MIGIYKIQNNVNGKIYIGQSVNIEKRWKEHIYELNANKHINKHLQSAWNKYGKNNFDFTIVCLCDISELDDKEMYYISKYSSFNEEYGYNLNIGGNGNKKYYDIDLVIDTYKKTNSILKTSEILNIGESKISEILQDMNIRKIESSNRKIVGLDEEDYSLKYEFDSIKDAYENFGSSITNQINKSIKDSYYKAFGCIWFDRDDYIKYSNDISKLLELKKYNDFTKYDCDKKDDYSHDHKTKVICITTNKIFNSIKEAANYYNIKSENGISYCCSYKNKTCNGLMWMYLDEYEYMIKNNLSFEDMKNNYNYKNVTKKVVCLNNRMIFNSVVEANVYAGLNIYSGNISEACQGKRNNAGKDKNGNPLLWAYYEDYLQMTDDDIIDILNKIQIKKNKKIVCITTNEIFDTVELAMNFAKLKSRNNIYSCCTGKRKFAGKHPITKELLQWMYYEDYVKLLKEAV